VDELCAASAAPQEPPRSPESAVVVEVAGVVNLDAPQLDLLVVVQKPSRKIEKKKKMCETREHEPRRDREGGRERERAVDYMFDQRISTRRRY
jgi:hypothetical protein